MARKLYKQFYAGLLLTLLLSVHVGKGVHIYAEDLRHFAAFNRDLVSDDNHVRSGVSERCIVCNFFFSPCLQEEQPAHAFYSEMLVVLLPEATSCKCYDVGRLIPSRAPPVA